MSKLKKLSKQIYEDLVKQNKKSYKVYAQQLTQLVIQQKQNKQTYQQFCIAFYNLGKLSNRYRYVHTALQFKQNGVQKIKWNLQMLALASSKGSHSEAYSEACKLISLILQLIQGLELTKQLKMFARQVAELINRPKSMNIISANSLNEIQMSRKFETDCPYVSKKFHIADIMIMDEIDPDNYKQMPDFSPEQTFFYYIVFLSISCFTRATEKFYCRESTDRDFHVKAIQIAAYLYSTKSTYLRFLRRTYKEHYLEHLDQIEQIDEYGQIKIPIPNEPGEVAMMKMPWQQQND